MSALRSVLCTLLVAAAHPAQAVQAHGAPQPSRPAVSDTGIIERGGTVDGVDAAKQAILVDGVVYAVPRGSVRIHLAGNRVSSSIGDLKRGMQIRFTSQKSGGAPQIRVLEIWVTGVRVR